MSITFKNVAHTYNEGSPFSYAALKNINLNIPEGKVTAVIGETGSGKTTLVQHLNALLLPSEGELEVLGKNIVAKEKPKNLKALRKQVGLVFQFPEYQLFEESVEKDIAFGPKNFGVSEEEGRKLAARYLELVGLDESYLERSPFELSGGQMRRVAIAGVLAMEPEVLVLDEPTAGLDPQGRKEMMDMFWRLHKEQQMTIVLVTHLMDDVANFADYVYVLEKGRVVKNGTPQRVFEDVRWVEEKQIGVPTATAFAEKLVQKGLHFEHLPLTAEELADQLVAMGGLSHDE